MTLQPGQTLSHYRLVEKIGEGGMGVVWKAADTTLPRHVAIKVLRPAAARDEKRRRLFLDEARLASSVSDARIAQVYELGRDQDVDFIVMEYVEGKPLSQLLRGRPLPPDKVANFGHQIAVALSRAHRKKLLHRDLKPGNVLVTPDEDVKVVDFGLATLFRRGDTTVGSLATTLPALDAGETFRGEMAGTLPYMSPEQVRMEKLDGRSDIFSLGTVLYEMATGQRPFLGATGPEVMQEILKARPLPPAELAPELPMQLGRIIEKALARRPGDRYQNMEDLGVDLKLLGRELESGSAASYSDLAQLVTRTRQRRVASWGVAGAAAVVVAAWAAWAFLPRPAGEGLADQGATGTTAMSLGAPLAPISEDRIAVFPFEVHGSEGSGLGEMMVDTLTPLLDGAGFESVDPRELLGLIRQQGGGPVDPPGARAIAEHFGAGLYILGSVQKAGESVRISAALYEPTTGRESVADAAVPGKSGTEIELADKLVLELFKDHLAGQDVLPFHPDSLHTDSGVALMAFLAGERLMRAGKRLQAIEAYGNAVDDDPSFGLAWWRMRNAARDGDGAYGMKGAPSIEGSVEHRDQLVLDDRGLLGALFEWSKDEDTGLQVWHRDPEEAAERTKELLGFRSEALAARYELGRLLFEIGHRKATGLEEAREMLESVLSRDPAHLGAIFTLFLLSAGEEQYGELAALSRRSLEIAPDHEYAWFYQAALVFWGADKAEQDRMIDKIRGEQATRLWALARFIAVGGNFQAGERLARLLTEEAVADKFKMYSHYSVAKLVLAQGRWSEAQENLAVAGDVGGDMLLPALRCRFHLALHFPLLPLDRSELEALRDEVSALETEAIVWVIQRALWSGLLNARLGESALAQKNIEELQAIPSEHEAREEGNARPDRDPAFVEPPEKVRVMCEQAVALIRAELAWRQGDPSGALLELEKMTSDLPYTWNAYEHYMRYLRGVIHEELGQDEEALRWYGSLGPTSMLSDRSFTEIFYLAPKHLRMGEIHEKLGNREQAVQHYARFVELWKNCDPELRPLVDAAEASLARLR